LHYVAGALGDAMSKRMEKERRKSPRFDLFAGRREGKKREKRNLSEKRKKKKKKGKTRRWEKIGGGG